MSNWTIFSNHGHVLFCLARDPGARLRDVAADVGITERAVQKIVRDLHDGGMISVTKSGRRNRYRIHKKQTLRHEIEASCKIRDLIGVVNKESNIEPFDVESVSEAKKSQKKNKPGDHIVDTGPATVKKPRSEPPKSEPPKSEPTESSRRAPLAAQSEGPEVPDGIEKQQGSLF